MENQEEKRKGRPFQIQDKICEVEVGVSKCYHVQDNK